ncbi:diacylglycerol/lipid kinase family protein [Namhaeicola litoreus]|uniref:Diacylglycerol/lipid kinase family protein n=1 Tax=Namhaeicola litoreus TaxID=1052145 RepID=A0ABW3Y1W0_9FLAO
MEKRDILVVINPKAGKSSYAKKLQYLEAKLREAKLDFQCFYTEYEGEKKLTDFLLSNTVVSEIIVLGGDGTLNYVVNEMQLNPIPISILSMGTGNDSVKSLHGELNFKKQVEIAIHGKIEKFDLGICNGRAFVNGVGIGFDGEVVRQMEEKKSKKGGRLDYLYTVLRIVAGYKEKRISFSLDGRILERKVLLMTISNGSTFGGGFVINPFAKANDGFLDVCILNEIPSAMRFWHLPKLKFGTHHKLKSAEFYKIKKVRINPSNELFAHLDGEAIGHPPFDISIVEEGLLLRTAK